jgi:hypothetical protein
MSPLNVAKDHNHKTSEGHVPLQGQKQYMHYLSQSLDKKTLMQIPYKQTNRYKNEHGTRKITRKHRRFAARHRHIRTIPKHRWLNPYDDRPEELS